MKYDLKRFFLELKGDLPNGEVTLKGVVKAFFFSPRFRVLLNHRVGKYFSSSAFVPLRLIGSYYKTMLISRRSCDFSYNAKIGLNLGLPHPIGVVIGDSVIIKDNVKIFQHVTLGSHGRKGEAPGYPTIESGVVIYAGSTIIGGITIGENAVIGANTLVNIDVPANSIAVGNPCKILF